MKVDKESARSKVMAFISEGESHCIEKHARVLENNLYESGEQWKKGDAEVMERRNRPAVPNNSILKIIGAVANREIVERLESRVYSRSSDDAGIANLLDEATRWQRDVSESEHEISAAFKSCVASGYGCVKKYLHPGIDVYPGRVCDEEVPIHYMLWPAKARKSNLVDRRWHVCGRVMTREEAEGVFGHLSSEARAVFQNLERVKSTSNSQGPEYKFSQGGTTKTSTLGWQVLNTKSGWYSPAQDEVFVIEAEWIQSKRMFEVAYPVLLGELDAFLSGSIQSITLGEGAELTLDAFDAMPDNEKDTLISSLLLQTELKELDEDDFTVFKDEYRRVAAKEVDESMVFPRTIEEVWFAIMVDGEVIYHGVREEGFTYEFMTGWRKETSSGVDFLGVVDHAKGPQDFKNKILSSALSVYMTSPKATMIVEDQALSDPESFRDDFASPVGVAFVDNGFVGQKDKTWTSLQQPVFPPMQYELINMASSSVEELFGLSSVQQGTQGDLRRISGTVVQAANTAGNTVVATFFDALRRFRRRFGLLNMKFLVMNYSLEDLIRVVGEDKIEDMGKVLSAGEKWKNVVLYDVKVDEAPVSNTERMETFSRLVQTGSLDNMRNRDDITFDEYMDIVPHFTESWKRKVKERRSRDEQNNSQAASLQTQLQVMQSKLMALVQQVEAMPGGQQIMKQYEAIETIAEARAAELQQLQQQPSPGGPEEMQGEPSGMEMPFEAQ